MVEDAVSKFLPPLFKKPYGPSKYYWQNCGTTGEALCEGCGTLWPESDEGVGIITVLGRQIVTDCCGRMVDALYGELGHQFAVEQIHKLGREPLRPTSKFLLFVLETELKKAQETIKKTGSNIEDIQAHLLTLNSKLNLK